MTDLTHDAFLGGKLHLWQPRAGYRAATDPVLLAAACPAMPGQTVLELGCGVGTASLCLHSRVAVALTGVEMQESYAALCRRNASEADIQMEVIEADLADLPADLRNRSFDHVLLNPPFYGPGAASPDTGRDTARREQTPLAKWVDTGLRRAGPKGCVTLIHLADRLGDLVEMLNSRAGLLEIKPIGARQGRAAGRVLLRLHKGRAARTIIHSPLILHEGDRHLQDGDDHTALAKAVLRRGEALKF